MDEEKVLQVVNNQSAEKSALPRGGFCKLALLALLTAACSSIIVDESAEIKKQLTFDRFSEGLKYLLENSPSSNDIKEFLFTKQGYRLISAKYTLSEDRIEIAPIDEKEFKNIENAVLVVPLKEFAQFFGEGTAAFMKIGFSDINYRSPSPYLIFIKDDGEANITIGGILLAHEVFHAKRYMIDRPEVDSTQNETDYEKFIEEEVYAYEFESKLIQENFPQLAHDINLGSSEFIARNNLNIDNFGPISIENEGINSLISSMGNIGEISEFEYAALEASLIVSINFNVIDKICPSKEDNLQVKKWLIDYYFQGQSSASPEMNL